MTEQTQPDYPAPSPAPPAPSPAEPVAEPAAEPAGAAEEVQVTQPVPPEEEPTYEQLRAAWDAQQAAEAAAPVQYAYAGSAPVPAEGDPVQPVGATGNVTPVLPPGAQAAAARAHRTLMHIKAVVEHEISYIERYVPAPVIHAAEAEVGAFIRSLL